MCISALTVIKSFNAIWSSKKISHKQIEYCYKCEQLFPVRHWGKTPFMEARISLYCLVWWLAVYCQHSTSDRFRQSTIWTVKSVITDWGRLDDKETTVNTCKETTVNTVCVWLENITVCTWNPIWWEQCKYCRVLDMHVADSDEPWSVHVVSNYYLLVPQDTSACGQWVQSLDKEPRGKLRSVLQHFCTCHISCWLQTGNASFVVLWS